MKPSYGADKSTLVQSIRDEEFKRRLQIRNEEEYNLDIGMSGTSCSLVIMMDDSIHFGYVGDSLICISKIMAGNASENTMNNDLILNKYYHDPSNFKEKMRIYRRRGEVRGEALNKKKFKIQDESETDSSKGSESGDDKEEQDFQTGLFDSKTRPRIYMRGRLFPGIAQSRSIGDYFAHRIGVKSEPTTGSVKLTR